MKKVRVCVILLFKSPCVLILESRFGYRRPCFSPSILAILYAAQPDRQTDTRDGDGLVLYCIVL